MYCFIIKYLFIHKYYVFTLSTADHEMQVKTPGEIWLLLFYYLLWLHI